MIWRVCGIQRGVFVFETERERAAESTRAIRASCLIEYQLGLAAPLVKGGRAEHSLKSAGLF